MSNRFIFTLCVPLLAYSFTFAQGMQYASLPLRVYCHLSPFLQQDNGKCFESAPASLVSVTSETSGNVSFAQLKNEIKSLQSQIKSLASTPKAPTLMQGIPVQESAIRYVYVKGEKGDRGDKGDVGSTGVISQIASVPAVALATSAFQYIPQPFWNGGGSSGGSGGSTIINNTISPLPTGGTLGQVLTINASGTPEWITSTTGTSSTSTFSTLFASNGLTLATTSTSSSVELGGLLTKDTVITQGTQNLRFDRPFGSLVNQATTSWIGVGIPFAANNFAGLTASSTSNQIYAGINDRAGLANTLFEVSNSQIAGATINNGFALISPTSAQYGFANNQGLTNLVRIDSNGPRLRAISLSGESSFRLFPNLNTEWRAFSASGFTDISFSSSTGVRFGSNLGSYTFPRVSGLLGNVLTSDGVGNVIWAIGTLPAIAENGLSFSTSSTSTKIELGGQLVKNTIIDANQNNFNLSNVFSDVGRNITSQFSFTKTGTNGIFNISSDDATFGYQELNEFSLTRNLLRLSSREQFAGLGSGSEGRLELNGGTTTISSINDSFETKQIQITPQRITFDSNAGSYYFPATTPLLGQVLTATSSGQLIWATGANGINGLTSYPSGIGLGGTLTQNTFIDQQNFNYESRRVPPANTSSFFTLENKQINVPLNPAFTSYDIDHAGMYGEKTYAIPTNISFGQFALGTSIYRAGLQRGVGEAGVPYFDAYNYIPLSDTTTDVHRIYNSNYGPSMYYTKQRPDGVITLRSYSQTRNDGGYYAIGSAPASSTRSDLTLSANGDMLLRAYDFGSTGSTITGGIQTGFNIQQSSPGFLSNIQIATSTGVRISDLGTNYTFPRAGVASGTVMGFDDVSGQLKFLTLATTSPAGITGQIQFNNAGLFAATSTLFWDNINGRLGIGTSTPTESLVVAGNIVSSFPGGSNIILATTVPGNPQIATTNNELSFSANGQYVLGMNQGYISIAKEIYGSAANNVRISNASSYSPSQPDLRVGPGGTSSLTGAGDHAVINIVRGIGASSGSANLAQVLLNPTIEQTGTANGITRGLYITPQLISAFDWRSIESTANVGYNLYISGTAQNYLEGALGIGTSTPATKLQVIGDVRVGATGTDGCVQRFDGAGLVGTCTSDQDLKKDIVAVPSILSSFVKLAPSTYSWNELAVEKYRYSGDTKITGLIAQEVENIFPELVSINAQGYKVVDTQPLQYYTVQAIKELNIALGDFTATSSTPESFADSSIFKKILAAFEWMGIKIQNGIASFKTIKTETLCVGETCITEAELKQLLQNAQVQNSVVVSVPSVSASTTASTSSIILPQENLEEVMLFEPVVSTTTPTQ